MQQDIIDFINKYEKLIDNNEWEEIYQKASDKLKYNIGRFTACMLDADIHPEEYLKELPKYFLSNSTIEEFTIPNNITSISDYAFYECHCLTSVEIPNSVTSIGNYAFFNCYKLINIAIPNNVTMIGRSTLAGCKRITNVKIPDNITTINHSAFHDCSGLTSVTIPDNVTSIDYFAFRRCTGLISVTIPNSVTRMCDYAFCDCGDNLIIYYQGSKEDWKKIYNRKSFELTYFTVNCTDGQIVKER